VRTREAAAIARLRLAEAGVEDAAFEAEYLVRGVTGLSRAEFFLDRDVADAVLVEAAVQRREAREPAPYITGEREFWGMRFEVGSGVLVPRPETELLVEIARDDASGWPGAVIADIGTGSGCIAISVARELPRARVVAIEISASALGYARRNAAANGARVAFLLGDLASPLGYADIVLANLPYIATDEIDALEPEVSHWEPRVALDGGGDGFNLIRRLVDDCATRIRPRLLALEVGYGMAATAAEIAAATGAATTPVKDFAGIDRVVCCRWP
jgi:release factor glutamine methyltransferase